MRVFSTDASLCCVRALLILGGVCVFRVLDAQRRRSQPAFIMIMIMKLVSVELVGVYLIGHGMSVVSCYRHI
jgi:hypothetical protein